MELETKTIKEVSPVEQLTQLCEKYFCIKLQDKDRHLDNVKARMTFSYILRKKGYGYQRIADTLDRHHSTIIHYIKNMDHYLKTDEDLRNKYDLIKAHFYIENDPILDMPDEMLINKIISLNNEKKELHLEIVRLISEQKIKQSSSERVQGLIDIVTQRTRVGQEKETEIKLNRFYNGLFN